MSAVFTVMRREIAERWTWLGLAVVLGFLPLAGGVVGIHDREMQATIALLLFLLFCASVMAGDLTQGRLGFLLARPLSWRSLWAGKLLAALVLTVFSVVVFVP